jgi:hypothetical protein
VPRQEKEYGGHEAPRTPSVRRANGVPSIIAQDAPSGRTPMSNSSVRAYGIYQISPTKSQFASASDKSSPQRSLRASMHNTPDAGSVIDKTLGFSPSMSSSRGRLNSTRVKVASQIEALYRAKSLEKRAQTSHEAHNDHFPITPTKARRETIGENVLSTPGRRPSKLPANVSPSRVGEMKKLFEQQVLNDPETPQSNQAPSNKIIEQVNLTEREGIVEKSQPPYPPPPPPLPTFSNRTSAVSPKTLRENLLKTPVPISVSRDDVKPAEPVVASPPKNRPIETKGQQMKSRMLGEKIRLFEDIAQRKAKLESRRKRRSISSKITMPSLSSRKSLFELTTRKSTKSVSKSLSSETIREIGSGSQREGLSTRFGKRRSQRASSYNIPQDAASDEFSNASYLIVKDDTQILLERTSASLDMVIKEAECGLREPKPMRLVEMKRMMLLCRDKAGFSSGSLARRRANVSSGGYGRIEDA